MGVAAGDGLAGELHGVALAIEGGGGPRSFGSCCCASPTMFRISASSAGSAAARMSAVSVEAVASILALIHAARLSRRARRRRAALWAARCASGRGCQLRVTCAALLFSFRKISGVVSGASRDSDMSFLFNFR